MTTKIKKIIVAILGLFVLSASASSFIQMIPQGVTNDYTALNITTGLGIDPTWEIRAHNTIQGGVSDALSIWGGTSGSEDTVLAIDGTNGNVGIGTVAPTAELTVSGRIDQIDLGESTFLGFEAGKVDDLTDNYNVGIGHQALLANTSGYSNVAMGHSALNAIADGYENIGIGYKALYANVSGDNNIAIGNQALTTNAGWAYANIGIGNLALRDITDGGYNVAVGVSALMSNTDGMYNIGVGRQALDSNTTGDTNVGLGYFSLATNATGDDNIAIGKDSGKYETGSDSFYINNQDRTNTAGDKTKSLMYGVMAAAAADQDLTINSRLRLSVSYTPPTSTTACLTGEVAWDASYIYVCTTTNWWERTAIAHW